MNGSQFEQIPVLATALDAGSHRRPGHLLVVDGQVREAVTIDPVADSVWILHADAAVEDAPLDELTVGRDWLVPCVRRANWIAAIDLKEAASADAAAEADRTAPTTR